MTTQVKPKTSLEWFIYFVLWILVIVAFVLAFKGLFYVTDSAVGSFVHSKALEACEERALNGKAGTELYEMNLCKERYAE